MRQLVLLRHATAQDLPGGRDVDRQLTSVGRDEARRAGRWLLRKGLVPDHVVTSAAPRAAQTARLACEALGLPATAVREDARLYQAGPAVVLRLLAGLPRSAVRVLLVGHNPTLEQVGLHLTGDEDLQARGLPKAGLVVADLPDDWDDLGAHGSPHWVVAGPDDFP